MQNTKRNKNYGKLKRFFFNGTLMTLCTVGLRAVAVAFNVYVAKVAGAEAVGLYGLLFGIYGFGVTLASSGIGLALTRLLSESLALNDSKRAVRIVKSAIRLALGFGIFSSILLFMVTKPLSILWLKEPRIIAPLRFLTLCLPIVAMSSVFNGYFTAVRRAYKNSISQLVETAIRISVTVTLFSILESPSPEEACMALIRGSVIAEFTVFIFNLFLFNYDKKRHFFTHKTKDCSRETSDILNVSLPVAITSYVRSALVSVEHSLIPKGLSSYGKSSSEALSSYGTLSGMALPVINFPYALIGPFTSLLVPEIAESNAKGHKRHIKYVTFRTYQCCLIFAFCVSGLMYTFADSIGQGLYSSSEAAEYIRLLSFLAPIMYADTSTDAILKGLGEQFYCMAVNIADAALSVVLVFLLVPRYGVMGYVVSIYIAETVNTALSVGRLIYITKFRFPVFKIVILPLLCAVGASVSVNLISDISAVFRILIYVSVYLILIRTTGCFSLSDIYWLKCVLKKEKNTSGGQ